MHDDGDDNYNVDDNDDDGDNIDDNDFRFWRGHSANKK